jgi:hypothetical protein
MLLLLLLLLLLRLSGMLVQGELGLHEIDGASATEPTQPQP